MTGEDAAIPPAACYRPPGPKIKAGGFELAPRLILLATYNGPASEVS